MSMTDPIADLLTRIRNAHLARFRTVEVPASKMKLAIVEILRQEGYVDGFEKIEDERQGKIRIQLRYDSDGQQAISGLERVSRPGRRVYRGKHEIPRVLGGLGITIVSTPKGVMTGQECGKQGVGGEVLCNVW